MQIYHPPRPDPFDPPRLRLERCRARGTSRSARHRGTLVPAIYEARHVSRRAAANSLTSARLTGGGQGAPAQFSCRCQRKRPKTPAGARLGQQENPVLPGVFTAGVPGLEPRTTDASWAACLEGSLPRSQALLQKLDFWLRNPDYLADELITRFETEGNDDDLELARQILQSDEPEVRSYQMLRYLFGAYEPLDSSLRGPHRGHTRR